LENSRIQKQFHVCCNYIEEAALFCFFLVSFPPVYSSLVVIQRTHSISTEKATVSASDEDSIADLIEQHDEFISSMQNRSSKLKVLMIGFVNFYY